MFNIHIELSNGPASTGTSTICHYCKSFRWNAIDRDAECAKGHATWPGLTHVQFDSACNLYTAKRECADFEFKYSHANVKALASILSGKNVHGIHYSWRYLITGPNGFVKKIAVAPGSYRRG